MVELIDKSEKKSEGEKKNIRRFLGRRFTFINTVKISSSFSSQLSFLINLSPSKSKVIRSTDYKA